jgi:hypothetical protein
MLKIIVPALLATATLGAKSEISFVDGPSSETIYFTAVDGLVIPGYPTTSSVNVMINNVAHDVEINTQAIAGLTAAVSSLQTTVHAHGAEGCSTPGSPWTAGEVTWTCADGVTEGPNPAGIPSLTKLSVTDDGTSRAHPQDSGLTSGQWRRSGATSTQELSFSSQPQGVTFKCCDSTRNVGHGTTIPGAPFGSHSVMWPCDVVAGLGNANSGWGFENIDFGFHCRYVGSRWTVDIYESGERIVAPDNFGLWPVQAGGPVATFKIEVVGNTVEYSKSHPNVNGGTPFVYHTSTKAPNFPLRVDATMGAVGSELNDVTIY